MLVNIIIFLFISIIALYAIERNFFNPITILYTIWLFIFILCDINYYGYYFSNRSILLIFIGLLASLCGYLVLKKIYSKSKKINKKKNYIYENDYYIKKIFKKRKLIISIQLLSTIILLYYSKNVFQLINLNINFEEIRYYYLDEVLDNNYLNILFSYLIRPFIVLMMPVSIYTYLILKNKISKLMIFLEFLNICLILLVLGERMILMDFTISFIIIFMIVSKNKNIKSKKLLVSIISIFIAFFLFITNARGSDLKITLYTYTSGCVPHFSYKINEFDNNPTYTYGFTSFHAIIRPFYQVIDLFNDEITQKGLYALSEYQKENIEKPIYLNSKIIFNGYISMFYYFYVDFGLMGIIILSFIFSILLNFLYFKLKEKENLKTLSMYMLINTIYISSYFQFPLSNLNLVLAIIFSFILFSKIKLKLRNV